MLRSDATDYVERKSLRNLCRYGAEAFEGLDGIAAALLPGRASGALITAVDSPVTILPHYARWSPSHRLLFSVRSARDPSIWLRGRSSIGISHKTISPHLVLPTAVDAP